MKTKSLALGAFLTVALLVAAESVVVIDHAGRATAAWSCSAATRLARADAAHFAQHLVRILVRVAQP